MSDIDITPSNAASSDAAAPPPGSDTQDSAPASVDTTAPAQAEPQATEADRQSRREARAFAAQRRELRESHRALGRMEAEIASLRAAVQGNQQGDGQQPPRQEPPPTPSINHSAVEYRDTVVDRLEEAGDGVEGFDKALETIQAPTFPGTKVMLDYLGETDKPAEMVKWLADNPERARQISRMSDAMAVKALEKAEATLAKPPAPKRTAAPPPPPTLGGGSVAPTSIERMAYGDVRKLVAGWAKK